MSSELDKMRELQRWIRTCDEFLVRECPKSVVSLEKVRKAVEVRERSKSRLWVLKEKYLSEQERKEDGHLNPA